MACMTGEWRDKDDEDLTAEDLEEMLSAGRPVAVRGPELPASAVLVGPLLTQTVTHTWLGGTGRLVTASVRGAPASV